MQNRKCARFFLRGLKDSKKIKNKWKPQTFSFLSLKSSRKNLAKDSKRIVQLKQQLQKSKNNNTQVYVCKNNIPTVRYKTKKKKKKKEMFPQLAWKLKQNL